MSSPDPRHDHPANVRIDDSPYAPTASPIDHRHGGPWDRGACDSYYRRGREPHYYVGDTYASLRVEEAQMTTDELDEYHMGFVDNERDGGRKY
jgi:hypothetical protein